MNAAASLPAAPWLLEPSARLVGLLVLAAVLVFGGLHFRLSWAVDRALYGGDGPDPDSLVNCPACGARTPADSPECEYCGASLGNA